MVTMTLSSVLLVHFIFLGLFSVLLCSNPESIIVQGPEDNEQKVSEFQMEKSQVKISETNSERNRRPVVRIMRPFASGNRIVWREVGRERLEKVWDYDSYRNTWNNYWPQPHTRRIINSGRTPGARYSLRRTTERSNIFRGRTVRNNINPVRTTERNINLRRMTEESVSFRRMTEGSINSGIVNEKSITDDNNKGPVGDTKPQPLPNSPAEPAIVPATTEKVEPLSEINSREKVTKSPAKISPDSNFFAGIVNDFAFRLMDTLNLETNFVVSPLSIFIALSMCYLGSEGRTKTQLEQVLGMDDKGVHGEHVHQGIKDLITLVVKGNSDYYQLLVANGMFLNKNFTAEPDFEKNLEDYYRTELKKLDFGNPQAALRSINDWVAENTRNMIPNMVNSPLPAVTPLILLNAVFFKGIWKTQFSHNLTYDGKFHSLRGTDDDVRLMTLIDETFPFYRSEDLRHAFIELPYKGDQMSMIIALPTTMKEKPMPSIRDQTLCYLRDAMVDTKLESVVIPKFHLEYSTSLQRPLKELGLTDIFDKNVVDLSALRKQNDIYVSSILQKSVIEVNEEGTLASSVTEVAFVPLTTRRNTKFVANHPFAFYIMHEPTGLVLFYGKIFGFGSELNAANNRRESVLTRSRPNNRGRF